MGRATARRSFRGSLSVDGINGIIGQLRQYESGLKQASSAFARRLAEEGFDVAQIYLAEATRTADKDKPVGTMDIRMDATGKISSAVIYFSGQQALFIEFGAGYFHNTSAEVAGWADQFGYGVGTYPRQVHANDEKGWGYYGEDNRWHHTMGTEGTAPLYHASQAIKARFIRIAKEVFQSVI